MVAGDAEVAGEAGAGSVVAHTVQVAVLGAFPCETTRTGEGEG